MPDRKKVFDAFRNCITEPKCRDCPWEQCEQFNQKKFSIPATLAIDVLNLLKEQEEKLKFLDALFNYINPNDMEKYMRMYRSLPVPSDGRSVKQDGSD